MTFSLPTLKYSYSALEPHIDAKTMEIHLTKHHQTYVTKLNEAVKGTTLENQDIEEILKNFNDVPDNIKTAVQNHGGGHSNHSLFWNILSGTSDVSKISPALMKAISSDLGGDEKFKTDFTSAATNRFGSGWAWLSVTPQKKLFIESSANQDSPLMKGNTPILGLDVWEHAYYLNYQNRRPDYINAFYNIIDWGEVSNNYEKAL